jgi:hypothetical protein
MHNTVKIMYEIIDTYNIVNFNFGVKTSVFSKIFLFNTLEDIDIFYVFLVDHFTLMLRIILL